MILPNDSGWIVASSGNSEKSDSPISASDPRRSGCLQESILTTTASKLVLELELKWFPLRIWSEEADLRNRDLFDSFSKAQTH